MATRKFERFNGPATEREITRHWAGEAQSIFHDLMKNGSREEYEENLASLKEAMPAWLRERMETENTELQQELVAAVQDPATRERFARDPWSRAGFDKLGELNPVVPFGFGRGELFPEATSAFVLRDQGTGGEAFFSGYPFVNGGEGFRGRLGVPGTLRHEASHGVIDAFGEERLVRAMDALYTPDLKGTEDYNADPTKWNLFRRLMGVAQGMPDADGPVPEIMWGKRKVPGDSDLLRNLSSEDRLKVLDAAGRFHPVKPGAKELSRGIPGDTAWGDFMRSIEGIIGGENPITASMKRWTELPHEERFDSVTGATRKVASPIDSWFTGD